MEHGLSISLSVLFAFFFAGHFTELSFRQLDRVPVPQTGKCGEGSLVFFTMGADSIMVFGSKYSNIVVTGIHCPLSLRLLLMESVVLGAIQVLFLSLARPIVVSPVVFRLKESKSFLSCSSCSTTASTSRPFRGLGLYCIFSSILQLKQICRTMEFPEVFV